MSSRVHVLIAALQVSLWFYQGFVLSQSSPVGWALLGSALFYHVLNAMTPGGGYYKVLGRKWLMAWAGWQLFYLFFPLVFKGETPNFPVFLNTLAFSIPCLVLVVLPLKEHVLSEEGELPLKL